MNQSSLFNVIYFCIVALLLTHVTSCYSPVEGCLDPEATNYSITADNDCDDCCVYPELSTSIFHENLDTTFILGDTIINDFEQQISLVDFVYLLSDFQVYSEDSVYEVTDVVSLIGSDGELIVKDDIIRVTRDDFTFEIGTAIFDGNVNQFSFKVGLSTALNENRFSEVIDGHPLTTDPDTLYDDITETYVFQRLQIAQGVDFLDTVIYDINIDADVTFDIDFNSNRGEDKTIIIEAQYDEWFIGVDFDTMDKETIEAKIAENSKSIFKQKD
ncbi:MAG: hypothetical protein P1U56_21605 [Saprospiraceae bacterium]|nr:hypothetical protein [Saprospiraceae bacterium]